jgi:hypothetical protein
MKAIIRPPAREMSPDRLFRYGIAKIRQGVTRTYGISKDFNPEKDDILGWDEEENGVRWVCDDLDVFDLLYTILIPRYKIIDYRAANTIDELTRLLISSNTLHYATMYRRFTDLGGSDNDGLWDEFSPDGNQEQRLKLASIFDMGNP